MVYSASCARLTRKSVVASFSSSKLLLGCGSKLLTRSMLKAITVGESWKWVRAVVVWRVVCCSSCAVCGGAASCRVAALRRDSSRCSQVGLGFSDSCSELGEWSDCRLMYRMAPAYDLVSVWTLIFDGSNRVSYHGSNRYPYDVAQSSTESSISIFVGSSSFASQHSSLQRMSLSCLRQSHLAPLG